MSYSWNIEGDCVIHQSINQSVLSLKQDKTFYLLYFSCILFGEDTYLQNIRKKKPFRICNILYQCNISYTLSLNSQLNWKISSVLLFTQLKGNVNVLMRYFFNRWHNNVPCINLWRKEEKSEDTKTVNRNQKSKNKDITVAKRKRTNNDLQNTIPIDQCEPH